MRLNVYLNVSLSQGFRKRDFKNAPKPYNAVGNYEKRSLMLTRGRVCEGLLQMKIVCKTEVCSVCELVLRLIYCNPNYF